MVDFGGWSEKKFPIALNKTIRLLAISDIFIQTGLGMVSPILAIFISDQAQGGSIFAAGVADTIYLITKSLVSLPLSKLVDTHPKYSKRVLLLGTVLVTISPLIYILSHSVGWIFFAQLVHATGDGMAYPTWLGLWSKNLDKGKESFEWSLYSTLTGLGAAIAAMFGAGAAQFYGFNTAFAMVSGLSFIGFLFLFFLPASIVTRSIEEA